MKAHRFYLTLILVLAVVSNLSVIGQVSADTVPQAMMAYQQDSYEQAFSIISEGIPETATDSGVKRQAADALAGIGVQEYDAKNYRNAYESFRKALKYDPTNTRATQYFLRMRKEMDTANLKNEGVPRSRAVATTGQGGGTQSAGATSGMATGTTQPGGTTSGVSSTEGSGEIAIGEVKSALEQADTRLKQMESSVASKDQENALLRAQAEQQMKLLQSFMANQPTAKPSSTATREQSALERQLIAQTVELLAKMSERESMPQQIVVQSDPAIQDLVNTLTEQSKERNGQGTINMVILALVGLLALGLIAFIVILTLALIRSRRANAFAHHSRYDPDSPQIASPQASGYLGTPTPSGDTPLLGFIGSNSTAVGRPVDFDVRKDLLKAERLKRMYDEVRNGSLNWSTIRDYIGELDVALKAEILKVVERKINEGDLLSSEAVLPVLFPLVTDYDDFIREKSEKLAGRVASGIASGKVLSVTDGAGAEVDDPLAIRTLMEIPKALQALFKTHEQSLVTAKISRGIGNVLGLTTDDCNLLYKSALAHDCGYLMLDQDTLVRTISKPEITDEDFAFIQSHVIKGLSYFGDIDLPQQFKDGILHHHERNDGSGYPDGLRKEAIPLFAKIIGVAETYAALVSKRTYRDKRDSQNALAIISDGARTKFDASIVEALVKVASSLGGQ